jgi:mannosyltransferase
MGTPLTTETPYRSRENPRAAVFLLTKWEIWGLFSIFISGICLRIHNLSYLSLWNDEAFSRYYFDTGLSFMLTEGLRSESSPPLYYMAIGAWIQLFGWSEAALRSLSVVSSSLAIILVYALGRELFGRRQGLVASALFALSATQIYYAQEARPYALLLIPVALILFACARYLRKPASLLTILLYVGAAILGAYTHVTIALFVASCGLIVMVATWDTGELFGGSVARRWIAANLCVALLALPMVIGMTQQVGTSGIAWIPPLNLHDIAAAASNTLVGTLTPGHFPGGMLTAILISALAIGLWRHYPSRHVILVILAPVGLYAALVLLVTVTLQPIILSRIFSWVGIPLCLIEAHVLEIRGWRRLLCLTVIGGTTAVGLFYQLDANADAKEPWRSVIEAVRPDLAEADLVVLGPGTDPAPLMYYAPRLRHVALWTNKPTPAKELGIMPGLFGIEGITENTIVSQIAVGERVIAVANADDEQRLTELMQRVGVPARRVNRPCFGSDGKPTTFPCGVTAVAWGP